MQTADAGKPSLLHLPLQQSDCPAEMSPRAKEGGAQEVSGPPEGWISAKSEQKASWEVFPLPLSRQTLPLQWIPGQDGTLQASPEMGLGFCRKHLRGLAAGLWPGQEANSLPHLPVWLQLGLSEKLRQAACPSRTPGSCLLSTGLRTKPLQQRRLWGLSLPLEGGKARDE